MRRWGIWEWMAYLAMLIAALILAADGALKGAPNVGKYFSALLANPWWAFSPLVFVVVATVILVARDFGGLGSPRRTQSPAVSRPAKIIRDNLLWVSRADILSLGDPDLLDARAEAYEKVLAARAEHQSLQPRRDELSAQMSAAGLYSFNSPDPPELSEIKGKMARIEAEWQIASDDFNRVSAQLLEGIYDALADGHLIAKAFPYPLSSDPKEVSIPSAQWRFLKFDKDLDKAEGEGIVYKSVVVANPDGHYYKTK
jgi:hypothetical protein